jgi:hypothetical protein
LDPYKTILILQVYFRKLIRKHLRKKRKGRRQPIGLAAHRGPHGSGSARSRLAQQAAHGREPACACAFFKRGLEFLAYQAEQRGTITTDLCFALKTREYFNFTRGSPHCARAQRHGSAGIAQSRRCKLSDRNARSLVNANSRTNAHRLEATKNPAVPRANLTTIAVEPCGGMSVPMSLHSLRLVEVTESISSSPCCMLW